MLRTSFAAPVVVALAVAAAGCGGSSNSSTLSPAEQWATGFCGAVNDWKSALGDAKTEATSNPTQDGLQTAAEDARTATDTLVASLKDLGAPDTTSGTQVEDAVNSLSTTIDTQVSSLQDTVNGISSIADLPSAIPKVTASLSTLSTAVSQTVTTIDNADVKGELKSAFDNAPECSNLTS